MISISVPKQMRCRQEANAIRLNHGDSYQTSSSALSAESVWTLGGGIVIIPSVCNSSLLSNVDLCATSPNEFAPKIVSPEAAEPNLEKIASLRGTQYNKRA